MAAPTAQSRRLRTLGIAPALALVAVALGVPGTAAAGPDQSSRADEQRRPNVIVIVTDDQPLASFERRFMPETFERLVSGGTVFDQFVVATPLCCPSRAALLTGQYGHNNGVLLNQYSRLLEPDNVLPLWLKRAGYRTMHVGRFFNGYGFAGRKSEVAPGWRIWRTQVEPHAYYDYRMRFNKRFRRYGDADRAYATSTFNRIAAGLVRRHAGKRRPFYLQLDHWAPHVGAPSRTDRCRGAAVPGPEDELAYGSESLPKPPSFDEEDISDKPAFLQGLPRVADERELTRRWRCQLAALREVDRGVGELWRALRERKALRDTVVIFTSDNGYLYGQHRIQFDKHYPYEEGLRVPLAIRLPGSLRDGRRPPSSDAPSANVDLAPTILELAGGEPCRRDGCRVMDGRSLLGEAGVAASGEIPRDRGIAIEYDGETPRIGLVCEYQGIRTGSALWVEHLRSRSSEEEECGVGAGEAEHYDLLGDPFQLSNLFGLGGDAAVEAREAELAARSQALSTCSGVAGRDPLPAGRSHCE